MNSEQRQASIERVGGRIGKFVRVMADAAREIMARAPHRHEAGIHTRGGESIAKCSHCRSGGNAQFEEHFIERSLKVRELTQHLPRKDDEAAVRSLRKTMEADWRGEAAPAVAWARYSAHEEREAIWKEIPQFMAPRSASEEYEDATGTAPTDSLSYALLESIESGRVAEEVSRMSARDVLTALEALKVPAANGDARQIVRRALLRAALEERHANGFKWPEGAKQTEAEIAAARHVVQTIRAEREQRVPAEVREALAECDDVIRWADLQVRGFRLPSPPVSELMAQAHEQDHDAS